MMNQTFLKWITKAFKSIISNDPDRGLFVLLRNCYDLWEQNAAVSYNSIITLQHTKLIAQ